MRFTKQCILVAAGCAFFFTSCSAKSWDTGYSQYGFYYSSDETIRTLAPKAGTISAAEQFILANAYKDKGDFKKAAVHFANSAFVRERNLSLKPYPSPIYHFMKKYSVTSDYYSDAAYELSVIFNYYSEYEYAQKFALLVEKDNIALYRDAVLSGAKALDAQKKFDDEIRLLSDGASAMPRDELKPVFLIRLGSVCRKKNDNAKAVEYFNEAITISPEGWQAAAAGKELHEMISAGNAPAFNPLLAAKGLIAAKEYADAVTVLAQAETVMTGLSRTDLAFARVKAFTGTGKIRDADGIIAGFDSRSAEYAQLLAAKGDILWQKGNRAEAVSVYESAVRTPSTYDFRNELKRICYYMYENNRAEAPSYMMKFTARFPDDKNADKMLWLAAKPVIERKDFSSARSYLDLIVKNYPDGDYSGHARFWIYKMLDAEGKKDEAEKVFRAMPLHSGGSVYTWILMERRKDLYAEDALAKLFDDALSARDAENAVFAHAMLYVKNGDADRRQDRMKDISSAGMNPYKDFNDSALKLSLKTEAAGQLKNTEKYFAAGHSEGIARTFNAVVVPSDDAEKREVEYDKSQILAQFGRTYEHYYSMISGMTGLFDYNRLQENIFLMDADLIPLILPEGFSSIAGKSSAEFGVERSLIYSIIKAESAFNHKAVSGAGATGLMQLMPPTAKDVARNLKMKEYEMKDPADAVRFGGYYLAWLNRFFKGNLREMTAGYNAGAGNVQKWKKQFAGSDEDLFAERVPFEETRGYMLKTEKYLIQYRLISKGK